MANCEKCGCDDKFLPSPAPCPEPPVQDKVDFTIDVYYYTTATSTWKRMTAEATTLITVNGTTGDITITLSSGSTYNKVRAVVVG